MIRSIRWAILVALAAAGVSGRCQEAAPTPAQARACLARVRDFHGGAGPWAVLGYRMGERALKELGRPRGSHDLTVVHESPAQVQYTCMADGLHAATGASVGKLTLTLREAPADAIRTVVSDRASGKALAFRPKADLARTIKDLPLERLEAEGARIAALPDSALFDFAAVKP